MAVGGSGGRGGRAERATGGHAHAQSPSDHRSTRVLSFVDLGLLSLLRLRTFT